MKKTKTREWFISIHESGLEREKYLDLWRWERCNSSSFEEVERQCNNSWFEEVEGGTTRDRRRENIPERLERGRARAMKRVQDGAEKRVRNLG